MDKLSLTLDIIDDTTDATPIPGTISLRIETKLTGNPGIRPVQMTRKTKTNNNVIAKNFKFDDATNILSFDIYAPSHTSFSTAWHCPVMGDLIATTFPDFCFMISDGTNPESAAEVQTPIKNEINGRVVHLGDLTHVLPSKIADDMLEAISVLNWGILEGIMGNAVLYGPYKHDFPIH